MAILPWISWSIFCTYILKLRYIFRPSKFEQKYFIKRKPGQGNIKIYICIEPMIEIRYRHKLQSMKWSLHIVKMRFFPFTYANEEWSIDVDVDEWWRVRECHQPPHSSSVVHRDNFIRDTTLILNITRKTEKKLYSQITILKLRLLTFDFTIYEWMHRVFFLAKISGLYYASNAPIR